MRAFIVFAGLAALPILACAQMPITPAQQISLAVLPLPNAFRATATVLGYRRAGTLDTLRKGTGFMTCLGTNPADSTFHAACYSNELAVFMQRGRDLRAHGTPENRVDSVRFAEIDSGVIKMPAHGAALWKLDGPMRAVDIKAGTVTAAVMPSYVFYIPYATSASTGLPDEPVAHGPWLMLAGTPKAHMMFSVTM